MERRTTKLFLSAVVFLSLFFVINSVSAQQYTITPGVAKITIEEITIDEFDLVLQEAGLGIDEVDEILQNLPEEQDSIDVIHIENQDDPVYRVGDGFYTSEGNLIEPRGVEEKEFSKNVNEKVLASSDNAGDVNIDGCSSYIWLTASLSGSYRVYDYFFYWYTKYNCTANSTVRLGSAYSPCGALYPVYNLYTLAIVYFTDGSQKYGIDNRYNTSTGSAQKSGIQPYTRLHKINSYHSAYDPFKHIYLRVDLSIF